MYACFLVWFVHCLSFAMHGYHGATVQGCKRAMFPRCNDMVQRVYVATTFHPNRGTRIDTDSVAFGLCVVASIISFVRMDLHRPSLPSASFVVGSKMLFVKQGTCTFSDGFQWMQVENNACLDDLLR